MARRSNGQGAIHTRTGGRWQGAATSVPDLRGYPTGPPSGPGVCWAYHTASITRFRRCSFR